MKKITLEAVIENLTQVTAFVDEQLEAADCPIRAHSLINVAVDELFTNVARYAYTPETGPITVCMELQADPAAAVITFIDEGTPYNPLLREQPDTTLPRRARKIGGLGIHMVKKTMDDLRYEYRDGQNVVTIVKAF